MVLDQLPLVVVKGTGLVQDVGVDRDLADVVQEGGPTEAVPVDLGQSHLFGDQVGVHAHPLAVATRTTIVHVERARQHENLLGGDHRRVKHAVVLRLLDASSQVPRTARLAGDGHTFWRLIGEHERHPEQYGQRQQSASQSIRNGQDDQGCAEHEHPPTERLSGAEWFGKRPSDDARRDDRECDGDEERRGTHER
jgi:hypothetical protein